MKVQADWPLLPVVRGEGAWLIDADERRILDAISSWWTNLFGHCEPRLVAALTEQLQTLDHVMLAGCTHAPAVALSERLAAATGLGHAFYASDGASATEIALKMSFHYWRNVGEPKRQRFVALAGGYHGETIGALSVTDVPIFRDAYQALLRVPLMTPLPAQAVAGQPCCDACVDEALAALGQLLSRHAAEIAALIVEPLVQGAAGMRMYPARYLAGARALCDQYRVHLIADEIMTGFGRTGTLFAHQQAGIRPDFICLSKGLTGGTLPLSCVLMSDAIYAAFYHDEVARGFLHSHSYTGNPLACRAALTVLDIFGEDDVLTSNQARAQRWTVAAAPLRQHPRVRNFRHLGMIWAFEVSGDDPDFARRVFAEGLRHGILLRPIDRTVYFMPPYVLADGDFTHLIEATLRVLERC
jgi:adenosylmethionine-8-amino-7-oxononanoate aminotransferase